MSLGTAEMAQQVEMGGELDVETRLRAALSTYNASNNAVQSNTAEMAQQEQGDLSAELDADMDDGNLFGDEPQHLGSPTLRDTARQDSVQPAASQTQGDMSEKGSQPTGLALPRLALPKLAVPKPAPVVVAEQPKVVEPVVTGRVEKKRAAPKRKEKGKRKMVAYSGARVPEQFAGQVTVRPATAPFVLEAPQAEDLLVSPDELQQTLDECLGPLDGDIEQQVAAASIAAQPAENDLFMPVDLTTAEPAQAQQQPPVASMAHQSAEIAQAVPPPSPPPMPTVYAPDDVDRDFAAGKWGRWNPKGMNQTEYVVSERQPYNENNPRDVYDYLQAVVASIMRKWPGKVFRWEQDGGQPGPWQQLSPSAFALMWFDCAWKRLCESYDAQRVEKGRFLPLELQQRLTQCHEWVAKKSLLNNSYAEETIETVMTALVKFSQMQGGMLQQGLSQQRAIVIE